MRLIDADKALERLSEDKREAFTKHEVWLMFSNYSPFSIDLIMCEECKWTNGIGEYCVNDYFVKDENCYCSYGKRRTDE